MKSTNLLDKDANLSLEYFRELFKNYYNSLLLYAFKNLNNRQAAEDVVQDVFLALWKRKDEVDFTKPMRGYLYKSVYNRSINYLITQRNALSIQDKSIRNLLHNEVVDYDQQESLLLKEISDELKTFVETLPPQCKKVFILSRGHQLKNKEIAIQLDVSEKTVEGHLSKALKELRNHFKKKGLLS